MAPRGVYNRKKAAEPEAPKPDVTSLVVTQSKMDKALEGLDKQVQVEVREETKAFLEARERFGHYGMEMGRHLAKIRDILEPIKRWKLWVRTVPTMSVSSAYRFINTWENAQKTLPPATLKVALLGGHRIISQDKDAGWLGTYGQAAKNVEARIGPPPAVDEVKAKKWVDELVAERRHLLKVESSRAAEEEIEIEPLETQLLNRFENILDKIPEDKREEFALRVIGMLMTVAKNSANVPVTKMKPVQLPQLVEGAAVA